MRREPKVQNSKKAGAGKDLIILLLMIFSACLALSAYILITSDPGFFKGQPPEPQPFLGWVLASLSAAFAIRAVMIILAEPVNWVMEKIQRR
ncbi:hypothetical protein CL689_03490 [Candidatus Saccharibacteria bacterium]|nr:hypothetical protein [Candidatus Saccharibacteria bacterium]|tara:strand:- start:2403 stop:2678 length:276 start_codon:yes stop_codon:yes gene_type:complete